MKGWITLHLLCETEESNAMKKMGVDVDPSNLKYNPHQVQVSQIGSIRLCIDSVGSFVHICGQQAETKESPEEIFKLIVKSQECDHMYYYESENSEKGKGYAKCSKCGFKP